jgi:hypothetical protein
MTRTDEGSRPSPTFRQFFHRTLAMSGGIRQFIDGKLPECRAGPCFHKKGHGALLIRYMN